LSGKTYILPDLEAKDITAALIKLQKERDALLQAQGHRQAALENLGKVAAEITQSQANLPEKPPDGEVGKWRAELEEVQPRLAALKDKLGRVWGGQPETFPAACPAIKGQTLSCPRAGETVAPPGQPSQAELNQLQADLAALGEEEQFLLDGLKVALNQEKAHDDAASDLAGLELRLARLQADAAQELPADLDAQLTRLENRLEIGRTLLAAVREWHIKADQAAQYQEMMARAAEEIDLYDALAKAFAPDGLPSRLLAEALGPVNDLLDQAGVHLFPGRSLGLTAELDIELSGCPFITLSKSARFRVGLAFQYALARLAGARLLLIDEADVLDPSNRAGLFDFLLEVRKHFDTILVGATASDAKPSPVPEIQVWWLENGNITALAPAR
jgi:DNA repair exonuclease SbcCD ATPase subunit